MDQERSLEADRLESIAADSWYAAGANRHSVLYSASVFQRHWTGSTCLELGPAEGIMTEVLVKTFHYVAAVEGSNRFCEIIKSRFPQVEVINSLFEDYDTAQQYDTIVLGHVLEHVENPANVLQRAKKWLAPGGRVCAAVPNARSIHRQAAVLMGLLSEEHALNDTDRHHGHRRIYDPESFRLEFTRAGLRILAAGGYWLKPLSNAQIDSSWTRGMLDAFMKLGEYYPDIAAEIYIVAS